MHYYFLKRLELGGRIFLLRKKMQDRQVDKGSTNKEDATHCSLPMISPNQTIHISSQTPSATPLSEVLNPTHTEVHDKHVVHSKDVIQSIGFTRLHFQDEFNDENHHPNINASLPNCQTTVGNLTMHLSQSSNGSSTGPTSSTNAKAARLRRKNILAERYNLKRERTTGLINGEASQSSASMEQNTYQQSEFYKEVETQCIIKSKPDTSHCYIVYT